MASSFQHPFQCLQYVERQSTGLSDLLIASAGHHIYSYVAASGQRISVWPANVDPSAETKSSEPTNEAASEGQGPPEKKRKLSSTSETQNDEKPSWSNVPILVASPNGKYIVALTAEDKSVRVLSLNEVGALQQLSSRTMPKRPNTLALTPDGKTILCGDKFGDVYSVPLIPSGDYVKVSGQAKPYKPVATALTVHTKRNLESLEQQKRQAELSKNAEDKTTPSFEHQSILGHVSLLTDLVAVTLPADSSGRTRSYILTADRDEHIRVSRGIPQAHVIERYCLGHSSFVSKLCVPSWAPELLISGGGDKYLLLWNWVEGKILQKVSLVDSLAQTAEVAVCGIWGVSLSLAAGAIDPVKVILVGLEGRSQLLCYKLESETLEFQGSIQLSGNVLDVVALDSRSSIAVSIDSLHEPDSTHTWESSNEAPQALLECFRVNPGLESLKWVPAEDSMAVNINSGGTSRLYEALDEKQKKAIDDSLYSLGNLRKRAGGDD